MPYPQNLLDVLIASFWVLGAWTGFKHGFLRSLIGLAGWPLSGLVGVLFSSRMAAYLEGTWGWASRIAAFLADRTPIPGAESTGFWQRIVDRWLAAAPVLAASHPASDAGSWHAFLADGIVFVSAFLLLAVGMRFLLHVMARGLQTAVTAFGFGIGDRLAGAVFGSIRNGVLAALMLGLTTSFAWYRRWDWLADAMSRSAYLEWLLWLYQQLSLWILA